MQRSVLHLLYCAVHFSMYGCHYVCTRENDHEGPHAAHDWKGHVRFVWLDGTILYERH